MGVGNVDGRVTDAVAKGVSVVGTGLGGGVSAMVKGSEYTSSELSTSCTLKTYESLQSRSGMGHEKEFVPAVTRTAMDAIKTEPDC